MRRIRCDFALLWYDLWVGLYIDREGRSIYVCPLPCVVFRFYLASNDNDCDGGTEP